MTGPRSRGCHTCRARRVKCGKLIMWSYFGDATREALFLGDPLICTRLQSLDETLPVCARCTKAKIQCGGYLRDLKIIDERPRIEKAQANAQIQQDELQIYQKSNEALYHSSSIAPSNSASDVTRVAPTLSLTAFSQNIFISFLLEHMFSPKFGQNGWWLTSALKATTPSIALTALATMFYGRAHRLPEVISRAVRHYSRALPSLRKDLSSSDALSYGPLVSVTTLTMYEVCVRCTCLLPSTDSESCCPVLIVKAVGNEQPDR